MYRDKEQIETTYLQHNHGMQMYIYVNKQKNMSEKKNIGKNPYIHKAYLQTFFVPSCT